jgi:hypothetical protein
VGGGWGGGGGTRVSVLSTRNKDIFTRLELQVIRGGSEKKDSNEIGLLNEDTRRA